MTVKATFTAAYPEARRISEFLERDYAETGAAISFRESHGGVWLVEAYFEDRDAGEIETTLRDRLGVDGFGAMLSVETLPETDWVAAGLETLKPVSAGRFVVHGPHDRDRVPPGGFAIEIAAGQAFGTGHHATTSGCLETIGQLARTRRIERPLDLGTGSGVLAIGLAKMLRRPVLATDIDPPSVRTARENARLNKVGPFVTSVIAAGVDHPAIRRRGPYDLIVANILAEPLARLAPRLVPLVAPTGTLVLSGLLRHQRERVVAAYAAQGFRLRQARNVEGWTVLVLEVGGSRRPLR